MASLPELPRRTAVSSPTGGTPSATPSVSPLQAVARHPFITALPVLLGLAVALAIGLTRPPVYTAQSRLGIVSVNLSAPGALGGFGAGAAQLAQAYARSLSVPEVRAAVERRTHLREDQLNGRLSAAAVANAPIFSVQAKGSTPRAAIDLANATSVELSCYVASINSTAP